MSQSNERGKPILTTLFVVGALSGIPLPTEQDCLQLADKLEKDPPPDLTSRDLSLLLQILRDEEIILPDEPNS